MPLIAELDILIVDDHAPTRAIIERALSAAGARRIRLENNGRAALNALSTQATDLLITDHVMPEIDGLNLIGAVRADPLLRHARIILITGYADIVDDARRIGADAVVVKPIEIAALLTTIESVFAER